ncbi:cytochrome P450 [Actinosynnema sp. NPDC047251]|nr:cytochrome P450 [Saccharothrix espanaensis]
MTELPDILSPEFAADPYSAYRVLRERAPLLYHEATRSWLVSRCEDVERGLRDPVFTNENYEWQVAPVHGRTMLEMGGREHAVRRALVAPAFRGTSLEQKFRPVIERNARVLVDGFRRAGRVELISQFATRFPINVIVDVLGLDQADHDRFHRWYTSVIAFLGNLSGDPRVTEDGLRTREEFAAHLIPIVRRRRRDPGDDLLSALCQAEVEGTRMSDEDVKSFCSLLLTAGGETTDKAVGSVMRNLLHHPEQLAAVRADRSLVERAFAESLRYTPPAHMVMRQTAAEVELAGGVIPAGATVTFLLASANRDGARYARPDEFDLFRADLAVDRAFSAAARHLSFALGRHFCVGALLAKAEVEVAVGHLLDAMPDARLAPGSRAEERGIFMRGPAELQVEFTPA